MENPTKEELEGKHYFVYYTYSDEGVRKTHYKIYETIKLLLFEAATKCWIIGDTVTARVRHQGSHVTVARMKVGGETMQDIVDRTVVTDRDNGTDKSRTVGLGFNDGDELEVTEAFAQEFMGLRSERGR